MSTILGPVDHSALNLALLGGVGRVELELELFEFLEIVLGDGFTGCGHGLLEVLTSDHRHGVFHISVGVVITSSKLLLVFFTGDGLANSGLRSPLAKLGHICSREALALIGKEIQSNVVCDWALAEDGLDDAAARRLIRERNVDQLVKTAGSNECLIKNLRSVGSADEEQVLLSTCTVHFCQQLVEDTITGSTAARA